MFEYNICNQYDDRLFGLQCDALEATIPGLNSEGVLHGMDGTKIKIYTHERGVVTVRNDAQVDALYINSDFDLIPYFEQRQK